jgi:putative ABC transport system ATP-binding protein
VSLLVAARSVEKRYGEGPLATQVLHAVDFAVAPGELVLLCGPSGSGKTTLVSILAGVLRPSGGVVELCGQDITALPEGAVSRVRRRHVGFVFQSDNLFPALTALENVAEVLRLRGQPGPAARAGAKHALDRVGLGQRLGHLPGQLSGGQRQRVAVARALAGRPRLLVGDEITAALDGATALEVMRLVRAHVTAESGALIVTHDRRLERFADRIVEMEDGRIVADRRIQPEELAS